MSSSYSRGGAGLMGGTERVGALDLDLALVDSLAAGGEQGLKVGTAETEVGDLAVGRGNDAVHPPCLVADLDAQARRDVQPAVAIDTHPVGAAVIVSVGYVQVIEALLVAERAVRLDLEADNPVARHTRRRTRATGPARGRCHWRT